MFGNKILQNVTDILTLLNNEPCASAIAMLTVLAINGNDEIPRDPKEQEKLVQSISDTQVVSFAEIIEKEFEETRERCKTGDTDFVLVLDSRYKTFIMILYYLDFVNFVLIFLLIFY